MGEVVAQLEQIVRRYPWQWFQFAPFWPELLEAGASVALADHAQRRRP
jgi:predicted LPLAT superfamily acyltransferase